MLACFFILCYYQQMETSTQALVEIVTNLNVVAVQAQRIGDLMEIMAVMATLGIAGMMLTIAISSYNSKS